MYASLGKVKLGKLKILQVWSFYVVELHAFSDIFPVAMVHDQENSCHRNQVRKLDNLYEIKTQSVMTTFLGCDDDAPL